MTAKDIALPALSFNGVVIRDRNEMLSLTDMWHAQGADPSQQPANWLASQEAKRFMGVLEEIHNPGISGVMAKKGKNGGTYAHWQIGLAYAKYLSPEFHMWCNTVVRERMEGQKTALPLVLDEAAKGIIGSIVKNCTGVVIREQLAAALPAMLDSMVAAKLAEQNYLLRHGKTAGQIWKAHGFPRLKVTSWFSNRLSAMGCQIEGGGKGELGLGTAKLFDPDKAANWLKNGGAKLVKDYVASRQGQGKLRLVVGREDV